MWTEGTRVPGTQTQVRSERESGCREKKSIQGEGLEWKSERVRWVHSGQQDLEGLAGAEARGGRGRLEFRAEDLSDAKERRNISFSEGHSGLWKMGGDGVRVEAEMLRAALLQQ